MYIVYSIVEFIVVCSTIQRLNMVAKSTVMSAHHPPLPPKKTPAKIGLVVVGWCMLYHTVGGSTLLMRPPSRLLQDH